MSHKLLLADDSVTIQRVIELTFADEDVQVVTAGDGEQAIASIKADRPDIVLADVGMPKRNGYDVAAFVKGEPELSHIPVLLLTGAFEPVDERRAQAAGCDGVLVKPFEPQHVIARVRELLQGSTAQTETRRPPSVTRAVADVPRPIERLVPSRPPASRPAAGGNGADLPPSSQQGVRPGSDLDAYFDRLDAAFANMANTVDVPAALPPEPATRREGPVMERDLDWFDSPAQAAPAATHAAPAAETPKEHVSTPHAASARVAAPLPDPVPVTFANPPASTAWGALQPPSIEPADSKLDAPSQAAADSSSSSSSSGSLIADAFSALLAAEQGDPAAARVRLPFAGHQPAITDEFVEEITRRVAARLGSTAVDDLVTDVVSRVAERLVREEIERIRKSHS